MLFKIFDALAILPSPGVDDVISHGMEGGPNFVQY